jgi:hypothetical protein
MFTSVGDVIGPGSDVSEIEALFNQYRLFVYERPLPQGRGLPSLDEEGQPEKHEDTEYSQDSSDES